MPGVIATDSPATASTPTRHRKIVGLIIAVGRGIAMFLGTFTLLNILGTIFHPRFDINLWWIDLRAIPATLANVLLMFSATAMLAFAFRPAAGKWRRITDVILMLLPIAAAICNTAKFYILKRQGFFSSDAMFPLTAVITMLLSLTLAAMLLSPKSPEPPPKPKSLLIPISTAAFLLAAFPLLQMHCFGKTDYRRRADAIIVFGAGVYPDGTPSLCLSDRVATGCSLYHEGLADKLIFSGGPGMGSVHETQAMKKLAIDAGIPEGAIILDPNGLNTDATIRNVVLIAEKKNLKSFLAVSHFYHLARIKMAGQRGNLEIYTVPAKETRLLTAIPWYITREIAAIWTYYLRPSPG